MMKHGRCHAAGAWALVLLLLVSGSWGEVEAKKDKKKKGKKDNDPYAEIVWPPPPDKARIKLDQIIMGRRDVEASSKWQKTLLGASPQSPYDLLVKPHGVAFDSKGRLLVTDAGTAALIRFDRENRRMDVFGTTGGLPLRLPLGLGVGKDDSVYVADATLKQVAEYDADGKLVAVYGKPGELVNPTDAALSPDGKRVYVADSKAHAVVVFDAEKGEKLFSFGERGDEEGQFSYPTSLVFGPEGDLFVVDQLNSRVQVFDATGEYSDQFGSLGTGFASFIRPKDIAVDEVGFIYVSDNAFNNVQIFDADFTLLTYVGAGGRGPGNFHGASGVAVHGQEFAVVDQLGRRVQIFRFIVPKDE